MREMPKPPSIIPNDNGNPAEILEDIHFAGKPLPANLREARIIINKTTRKLYLYSGSSVARIYPVSLGFDPENDKEKEGDGRTPEGIFYVCNKNPQSRFYLSLGVSYPNLEDAERGLKDGIISYHEYEMIVRAMKHNKRPPWFTPLGGAICIHGGGVDWDWTEGCIALENSHMQELYRAVPVGTPIVIKKSAGRIYGKNRNPSLIEFTARQ